MQSEIDEIVADFEFLDDWSDRYKYLIELGNRLPALSNLEKTAENKVRGCVSQVWITVERSTDHDPVMVFHGDSDAHIVRGLVAVVFAIFSNKRASEIVDADADGIFDRLGLREHITPQRSNGLHSMVGWIRNQASNALPAA